MVQATCFREALRDVLLAPVTQAPQPNDHAPAAQRQPKLPRATRGSSNLPAASL
eukprot:m.154970 g.154970  ORF g.154970 m.154970 type:complete len:54 (+) comp14391_c0_seq3:4072-4233(+)